eukprot:CAMPEP_0197908206 /NCGR_PEP_ID=MMETSP1439-20131203/66378_1 /TAXON_ID=66791 /ORGANISM="Gonyaulax spinifera, Strain CCMP409" /LENGTH=130 /DNA_ID=CAMNT_0043529681 /DNA_START=13 /DNA_END=402 /DNA_ORIENTATION=-
MNLINVLGIVPRTHQDQAELGRIISEASREVGFPEFERLVLKVKERVKMVERHKIFKATQELRYTATEVEHLREMFASALESANFSTISIDKLQKCMENLGRKTSHDELEVLVSKLCPGGGVLAVDFEKF